MSKRLLKIFALLAVPVLLLAFVMWQASWRPRRVASDIGWNAAIKFSPDGKLIAGADRKGGVQLWDVRSGRLFKELSGHRYRVMAVAFSADSRLLASSSRDGAVRLWDISSGQTKCAFNIKSRKNFLELSSAGWLLDIPANNKTLRLFDMGDRVQLWDITGPTGKLIGKSRSLANENALGKSSFQRYTRAAFLSRRNELATWTQQGITLWSIPAARRLTSMGGKELATGVEEFAASSDGRYLAIIDGFTSLVPAKRTKGMALKRGKSISIWDMKSLAIVHRLSHPDTVRRVAISDDGSTVASVSGSLGTLTVWNVASETIIRTIPNSHATYSALSPDGTTLASVHFGSSSGRGLSGGQLGLWRVR